ncbi:hypothetical protein LEMLEM_LOCUS5805 [Lemmus lemmus]
MKEALQTRHPCCPEEGLLTTVSQSWYAQGGPSWPLKASGPCCCLAGLCLDSCAICCYPGQSSCWCCCQQLPLSTWDSCATQGFIQPRVHGAERCSPIAVLQRSLCSDSSPCRLSWCSPRPPARSWSGDCALSCLPRREPPNRAACRDAAKKSWRAAALTKRNSFVPGSDASETSPCREPPLDFQKVDGVERPPLGSERSARSRQEMATGSLGPGWCLSLREGRWFSEKVPWALLPHQANAFHSYLWSAASFADIYVSQNQASPRSSSATRSNQTS